MVTGCGKNIIEPTVQNPKVVLSLPCVALVAAEWAKDALHPREAWMEMLQKILSAIQEQLSLELLRSILLEGLLVLEPLYAYDDYGDIDSFEAESNSPHYAADCLDCHHPKASHCVACKLVLE